MSKKDYINIAQAIQRAHKKSIETLMHPDVIQSVIDELVTVFYEDNPRFSREKFINFINKKGSEVNEKRTDLPARL